MEERCRFCGKERRVVRFLIAARGEITICDECVALSRDTWEAATPVEPVPAGSRLARVATPLMCSFCRETVTDVIQGPGVAICRPCTQLCLDILAEKGISV